MSDAVVEESNRGFKHGKPIPGAYGGNIKAYESSTAFDSRFWIKAESPVDANYALMNPDADDIEMDQATVLLRADDLKKFIEQLQYLYDNHYHREYYGTGELVSEEEMLT